MKKNIHPNYNACKVTCVCGNTFTVGSTAKNIEVEICSKCHPFYTGKQKLVDSARRVEKFEAKASKKATELKNKKAKRAAKSQKRSKDIEIVNSKSVKIKKIKKTEK